VYALKKSQKTPSKTPPAERYLLRNRFQDLLLLFSWLAANS
jgi:hypothetical protein